MKSRIKTKQVFDLMPEWGEMYPIVELMQKRYPDLTVSEIEHKMAIIEQYHRKLYVNINFYYFPDCMLAMRTR